MDEEHRSIPARSSCLNSLAWLPIPLLLAAMGLMWALDLRTSYESQFLMMVFNFVFNTAVNLAGLIV